MVVPGTIGTALAGAFRPPQLPPNLQTALRLACNAFAHPALRAWAQSQRQDLIAAAMSAASSANKGVQQGIATLLLNYAVQFAGPYKGGPCSQVQHCICLAACVKLPGCHKSWSTVVVPDSGGAKITDSNVRGAMVAIMQRMLRGRPML